jgi:hypothetical protein
LIQLPACYVLWHMNERGFVETEDLYCKLLEPTDLTIDTLNFWEGERYE